MASAGVVADILLSRVYATGGFSHLKTAAINVLSRCQRAVNALTHSARLYQATFATLPYKQVYDLTALPITQQGDILEVTVSNRRLFKAPSLAALDTGDARWFRATGTRFEAWKQVSRDILVITPALATASTVDIKRASYTPELVLDADIFYVPDKDIEQVLDLAEIVLLMQDRQLVAVRDKLKKFGIGGK